MTTTFPMRFRPRPSSASPNVGWLGLALIVAVSSSGCYYHVTAGPALQTADGRRWGAVAAASSGLNGLRGGIGLSASGGWFREQVSGMVGIEAFRLFRGESRAGPRPYVRGGLGLVELGRSEGELLFGALSPRAELGLMWLDRDHDALSLSAVVEHRFRVDGLSSPVLSLQLGVGGFDFLGSTPTSGDNNETP